MSAANSSTKTRERCKLTISGDAMSATLLLFKPHDEEPPIKAEEVQAAIKASGIVFGLKEEVVSDSVVSQIFNKPILIAEGVKPKKGESSTFEFTFDTTNDHKPTEDEDGRIDYRNINFIQNIEKGGMLAIKTPATAGIPGRTVRNKELKAPSGRDVPFNKGVNTEVSEDGLQLTAAASGAIVFKHGKVYVNDLTVISGDLDHQVGNIDCMGSVKVTGNIKAGYEVKVEGDLEVQGHVEDATITVGGNISIKGGFFGKGDGLLKADGNVTLKYAEGQNIEAGGSITVGGELINCNVFAKENIIFQGARGKLIGGETKAGKEIKAAEIGTGAGTVTHLYVAFDVELMHKHSNIQSELNRLASDNDRVKEGLYALYKLELAGKLPSDKKAVMNKLKDFQEGLPAEIETLEAEKSEVEAKLREYDDSHIVAETKLHAGTVAHFGVVYKEITSDHDACKLTIQDGKILMSRLMEEI